MGQKSNNSQAYNPPHEGIRLLVETIFLIFWLYNNIYKMKHVILTIVLLLASGLVIAQTKMSDQLSNECTK